MEDYLSEDEQAEKLKRWFRDNWLWLAGTIALAVAAGFGLRWWESRQQATGVNAAAKFGELLRTLEANDRPAGLKLAGEIAAEYGKTPYADQAELVIARVHVEAGEYAMAEERLRKVIDGSEDPELALVARTRLARLQIAQDKPDEAIATLAAIDAASVDARVNEIRGDALLAKGDRAGALAAYEAAQKASVVSGPASGLVDQDLLELKIADLADVKLAVTQGPAAGEQP